MRVSVGAPVVVDGRLWGVISARWSGEQLPPPTPSSGWRGSQS